MRVVGTLPAASFDDRSLTASLRATEAFLRGRELQRRAAGARVVVVAHVLARRGSRYERTTETTLAVDRVLCGDPGAGIVTVLHMAEEPIKDEAVVFLAPETLPPSWDVGGPAYALQHQEATSVVPELEVVIRDGVSLTLR
jgi:hypothetical protein